MLVNELNLPHKRAILSNVFWLALSSLIGQGFTALSVLLTARSLGPASFGQYSACIALTRLGSIIFNLGMDTWLLREGRKDEKSVGIAIAGIIAAKFALGMIWGLFLLVLSRFLDPEIYPLPVLCISAAVTWLEALLLTLLQGCNIFLKNYLALRLTAISSSGLLISTLALASMPCNDPFLFLLARWLADVIAAGAGLVWLTRISSLRLNRNYIPRVLIRSLPFAISDILLVIYTQVDVTLVALLLDARSAGLYSSASSILRAAFVIPASVYSVMTPIMSRLAHQGNLLLFAKTARRTYLWLCIIGLGLWLGMFEAGPILIRLILRESFNLAGNILLVLSAILFLKSCSYASTTIIIATNNQIWRVVVQGIVAFVNVGLNFLVIPIHGALGAAWVYVISETLLLVGYLIIAAKGYFSLSCQNL